VKFAHVRIIAALEWLSLFNPIRGKSSMVLIIAKNASMRLAKTPDWIIAFRRFLMAYTLFGMVFNSTPEKSKRKDEPARDENEQSFESQWLEIAESDDEVKECPGGT
jgi:hypothetical protein